MTTPGKKMSAKQAPALNTSTTKSQNTSVKNAYDPSVLLPDEIRVFHTETRGCNVALGTIKKDEQGRFSKITVPAHACDKVLKDDMREGFISISAVFTQLASQAPAHLPNFNVTGDEYVAHKVPTVPNCFYGNGTKKSSKSTVLAVRTDNGYVVIAMVNDWKVALKSVRDLARGLQAYGTKK